MGKRSNSGQRALGIPPQSMVRSGMDRVALGRELSGGRGLLGALLGRAGLQSPDLAAKDAAAAAALTERQEAYVKALYTPPKGRPGRPKGSKSKVVKTAARVWSEVTGGQGVVLVDGKPVKGGAHQR